MRQAGDQALWVEEVKGVTVVATVAVGGEWRRWMELVVVEGVEVVVTHAITLTIYHVMNEACTHHRAKSLQLGLCCVSAGPSSGWTGRGSRGTCRR